MKTMVPDEDFFKLIHEFLTFERTPDVFCDNFTDLWIQQRDEIYSQQDSWPERYDLQLMQALQEGKLSQEEFGKQWRQLWGNERNICVRHMIDAIHSMCSVFNPTPTTEWEINETSFRAEVTAALADLEKCKQASPA